MYLIVGLGNPEQKYFNTFHNMGFMAVDRLAEKLGVTFTKGECRAVTAHARVKGEKVIVAKPVTYMNLSGEAVQELVHKYKIEKGKLIVVYDDVDIAIGKLRIRQNGTAGTHNGMKNIVKMLSTEDFPRVRVGIGKDTPMELVDYVLSQVSDDDLKALEPVLDAAANALYDFVNGEPIDHIMQKYNVR